MNKTVISVIVLVVIIGAGLFLVTRNDPSGNPDRASEPAGDTRELGVVIPIRNHKIATPEITVPVGATVTWNNEDNLAGFPYDEHSPTSGDIDPSGTEGKAGVVPNSGSGRSDGTFALSLSSGASQSFTFRNPGVYTYYIAEHPLVSGEGRIIVEEGTQGKVQENVIALESKSFSFSPNTLEARVGEQIAIDITAVGQHTFTIDELGVDVITPHNATTRVEFTPEQSGTFEFYCAIPGHREAGQVGTLTVGS